MVIEAPAGMRFVMRDLPAKLGLSGPNLLGRQIGERVLPLLRRQMDDVPLGGVLVVDLSGVPMVDASFPDATVIALAIELEEGRHGDRYLLLEEPSEDVLRNIEAAISWRHDRTKRRVALLGRRGGRVEIIGRVEAKLHEAWQLVRGAGEMTARELADRLDLEINNAGTRLLKLHSARLLTRREEISASGRQHVYAIPG